MFTQFSLGQLNLETFSRTLGLEALFPFDANRLVQNQKDAVKKCEVIY
jgi:hypothetical protein